MKYNELIRLLKKAGCYDTGRQMGGHPLWTNPKTGVDFKVSNHGSQEVATGTLKNILKAAGMDMSNVVKTTVLLADIADFAAMNEVYAEFFSEPYPARAAFQAAAIPKGAKVEIEATACGKN